MKSSTMALAVGAGYMLGRKHKLGMATVLAAGAATAGASGIASKALGTGGKLLMSSQVLDKLPPEATKIIDLVKSDLVQAGRSAAQAAVTSRIEGLTSALNDRADAVRNGQEPADDDGQDEETDANEQDDEDRGGDEDAQPRRRARQRPATQRASGRSSQRPAARRRTAGSAQAKPAARRRSSGAGQAKSTAQGRSAGDGQAKPATRRRSAGNGQAKRSGSGSGRRTGR